MANLALKSLTGAGSGTVVSNTNAFPTQTYLSKGILSNQFSLFSGPGAAAWPVANLAIFVPFRIEASVTGIIRLMAATGGLGNSGNIDLGIYDSAGVKIITTGSTVQAASFQIVTIASTNLTGPGLFYMAMALDNAVGTNHRETSSAQNFQLCGLAEQTTAFPLPATATLASAANNYFPAIGWATWAMV